MSGDDFLRLGCADVVQVNAAAFNIFARLSFARLSQGSDLNIQQSGGGFQGQISTRHSTSSVFSFLF
jgi:hypothetical protein